MIKKEILLINNLEKFINSKILYSKPVVEKLIAHARKEIKQLSNQNIVPGLAVVLIGDNPASKIYVRNKHKFFLTNHCHSETFTFDLNISQDELLSFIEDLNQNNKFHGILVQLPLPNHIDSQVVINSINPSKDVDGFHSENLGKLFLGHPRFIPCTPYGIVELLDYYDIETTGKHAVIVGRSNIVGKPMVSLLSQSFKKGNATVTVCHSKTNPLRKYTLQADILIAATGVPNLITSDMINKHVNIIDVGINRVEDDSEKGYHICGDVDFKGCSGKVNSITPVPGGVGPMTIMMLLINTIKAAKNGS